MPITTSIFMEKPCSINLGSDKISLPEGYRPSRRLHFGKFYPLEISDQKSLPDFFVFRQVLIFSYFICSGSILAAQLILFLKIMGCTLFHPSSRIPTGAGRKPRSFQLLVAFQVSNQARFLSHLTTRNLAGID
jgi:hypothetical protein